MLSGLLLGCGGDPLPEQSNPRDLPPYPNPFTATDPLWSPQPVREKPQELLVVGDRIYVPLPGTPDEPGHHVAVLDRTTRARVGRIEVGAGPVGIARHPSGLLLVLNRYSNFASVIDPASDTVVQRPPVDFYGVEAAFTPDGSRLAITNRWRDEVQLWSVVARGEGLVLKDPRAVSVGSNPRDLAVYEDGRFFAAAAHTGLNV